ncbi:helix-turn-helix domain-containing protein [Pseudorhodoferax sp. Leaf265]|uniref:helix-turn-helix domain-containing protein n=1 Tax=Pseudorhodoferax sp. Leaf265 TaxID=1736315 RepID=UPI0006F5CD3E|nr:helix-turn-helix domain-containing protein [Pseudorhodoferax sp. Leaf265]KQP19279.1 AraC family transcriptional regulator [Pseudorhodoferax sp. Leaf265]
MIPKQTLEWTTAGVSPADKTDLWESVLSSSYREWQVPRRLHATFFAHVKQHAFAGSGLVETICDPCSGRRTKALTRKDEELYVGVQLTTAGRERFKMGDSGIEAKAGDLVVWTTDAEVEFEVLERLHKITLMIPWTLLRERLPERRFMPLGGKIESRAGIGSLLAVHLLGLSNQIDALSTQQLGSVSRTTLEFLGIALAEQQPVATFDASTAMLRRAQNYILQNLHDEGLTPASVAAANRISLRYLHLLFQRNDATVGAWIQERRLAKCKEGLTDPACSRQRVADIAYRWGFTSTSHFSRVFKERYGMSPGDARAAGAVTQI